MGQAPMDDLAESRIVIVGEGDEAKGFLVDEVREVVWVEAADLEAVEPGRFTQFGGLITGVAKLDPLVWLPDVAKLLAGRIVGDGGDEPATKQNAPVPPEAAEPARQPRPPAPKDSIAPPAATDSIPEAPSVPVPVPEPVRPIVESSSSLPVSAAPAVEGRAIVDAPPHQPVSTAPAAAEKPDAPLYARLSTAMHQRGLRGRDMAEIFGTTPPTITYWLRGAEFGPDGKILGRRIPPDAVPMVARWIETGEPPTEDELDKIPKRKSPRTAKKKRGGTRPR